MPTTASAPLDVSVGLPDARQDFVAAARDLDATMLFSASAFARRWTLAMHDRDDPFPGFRAPPAGRFERLRFALDSSGFTSMARFGDSVFSAEQYAVLVEALHEAGTPPLWAASMDICCEPEVARDREEVMARIMRTAWLYDEVVETFRGRGFPDPIAVLQGWHAAD